MNRARFFDSGPAMTAAMIRAFAAQLYQPPRAAFRRVPDAGIFQVQLALDAAAGIVADLAAPVDLGDAGALGLDELQLQRIQQVNPVNYIAKDSPPALIICAGGDTGNVIANCTVMFDKYVEKAADAQYYAWAQGAHVRVGPNIEDASVAWLADKLGAQVPVQQQAARQ